MISTHIHLNVVNEEEIAKAIDTLSYLVEFGECEKCKVMHASLYLMLINAVPRVNVSEKVRKKAEKLFEKLSMATYGQPVPPNPIPQEEFEKLFTTWKETNTISLFPPKVA